MEEIDVSIIVITYNTKDLISWCLDKLLPNLKHIKHEVIVVDNGSSDDSSPFIKSKYPGVKLITTKKNLGFGGGNNLGLKEAKGRYIVLLNSDAYTHPGSLEKAIDWMDTHPDTGAAGAKLISEDGSWQPYARKFPSLVNEFLTLSGIASKFPNSKRLSGIDNPWYKGDKPLEVDWVTGAFMIFPKKVLDKVGHFDERFYLYLEEVDLCRRIKEAGYKIWALPNVVVTHLGGVTCNKSSKTTQYEITSGLLYYRKHHRLLGAKGYKLIGTIWHHLRKWKNQLFPDATSQDKIEESDRIINLLHHTWKETEGGKISPPIPWRNNFFNINSPYSIEQTLRSKARSAFYWSGISHISHHLRKHPRAVVLMYHSVSDDPESQFIDERWRISTDEFEEQINYLAKYRNVVPLTDLIYSFIKQKPLSPGTIALTFDDGYLDNLKNVIPLLEKHQLPATIFIPTEKIDTGENMWVDELYTIFKYRSSDICHLQINGTNHLLTLGSPELTQKHFLFLNEIFIQSRRSNQLQMLQSLKEQLRPYRSPPRLMMNWKEIKEIQKTSPLISIGGHSHEHCALSTLNEEESKKQIRKCLKRLKEELSIDPKIFCFPYGRYSAHAAEELKKCEFIAALGNTPNKYIDNIANPYCVPRVNPKIPFTDFRFITNGGIFIR